MKKYLIAFAALFAFALVVNVHRPDQRPTDVSDVDATQTGKMVLAVAQTDESLIRYAEFDGNPVELSISGNHLILRVFTGHSPSVSDDDSILTYLTHEVERLTTGRETKLGSSGYTFQLTDGIPIWGPHSTSMGANNYYKCLEFAEGVKVSGSLITAVGRLDPVRPEEYYPYKLNPKQ